MSYLKIDHEKCILCGLCTQQCPFDALEILDDELHVDDKCTLCGACVEVCPEEALAVIEEAVAEPVADAGEYSGVLVVGELSSEGVHPVTFELIGAGRRLADARNEGLAVVLLGDDPAEFGGELARYPVDRIFLAEHPALKDYRCGPYASTVAALAEREKPEIVLCGATADGRSFFPRVAALLKTGLTADCTRLEIDPETGNLLQTRPAFGGNIMATIVTPRHRPQLATVRPKVLQAPEPEAYREVKTIRFQPPAMITDDPVEIIETVMEAAGKASIADADIIVAGGRGVGSADGFKPLRELAEALGGAVGASRAAVDSGWIDYSHQVGQTGKTVQPKLYIACGISGAIQHLVGMQSAGMIIAINKDPDAAIFSVADYGFVGDLHVITAKLIAAVREKTKTT